MPDRLKEKLSGVSSKPGVYLMKDDRGQVIYVGKAANLKKRLASYFKLSDSKSSGQSDMKTGVLIKKISAFETIVTATENEALILESNLIKHHKPRYNVILKDDKQYPCLRLDIKSPYPFLVIARKIKNDGALYFGPFSSPPAVYQALKIINKTFRLRKCVKNLSYSETKHKSAARPCLNYQIGACLAPCCRDVDKSVYDEMVKEVILFLKGKTPDLIRKIKDEMTEAAHKQDYETAAMLRDRMFAIKKTVEKQVSVSADLKDRDVIAIARAIDVRSFGDLYSESDDQNMLITMLFVRGGYLIGTRHFNFTETLSSDAEIIRTFIRQYYENAHIVPKEILVSAFPEDALITEEWLKSVKGEKVRILHPKQGEKARLLEMAVQNAKNALNDVIASNRADTDILVRLQKLLKMENRPNRIECFDNSNISGTSAVAAMVVFEKGKPCKSAYRVYKIKTVPEHNDYAYMAEILKRRYSKISRSQAGAWERGDKPFPDILMVDGGKGQLNIAVSVIKELNLEGKFEIISIAKKNEKKGETQDKIYKPGRTNPINFGRDSDLLFFLQRIRDEAHHHAISFHYKQRTASTLHSRLDTIPGIGKKRKQTLLKHFGSIKNIRMATLKQISSLPGMNDKLAEAVKNGLG